MKSFNNEGFRFVLAGGGNTALTYLAYLALLNAVGYPAAFSLAFAAGVVISYLLNAWFVFKTPLSWHKLVQFPLLYLVQYLAGLLVLNLLIEQAGIGERVAPIFNVVLMVPLTFFLNRWFLRRGSIQ